MSQSGDHYAPNHQNPPELQENHKTEPADPAVPNHSARRSCPLAPDPVKLSRLPEPFVIDNGRAVSVEEAGKIYLKIQRSNWKDGTLSSKYERHKYETYPQILEADRHFREKYDGLTTVMLSRRLSPTDDTGSWLTPWECNEMLHGGGVHRSIRNALNYHLDYFEFEWIAVTAPTRSAGTPHEHIYLWIDDPDDEITIGHIEPTLDKHLKYCANAKKKHHQYQTDGTGGALTVRHTPGIVDSVPDEFFNIAENSPTYDKVGKVLHNTQGAQYLASQLAHLPLADYYEQDRETPPQALFEGAALAWASPYNWFRASGGVPS